MRRVAAFPALTLTLLLLAACGQGGDQASVEASPTPSATAATPAPQASLPSPAGPTGADLAVLENRDCGVVAQAFAGAVANKATTYASLFWNADGEGKAAFDDRVAMMDRPALALDEPSVEGAAGSLYCTVEASLSDAAATGEAPFAVELLLRRVNDVDGATAEQLRWSIRSATFR